MILIPLKAHSFFDHVSIFISNGALKLFCLLGQTRLHTIMEKYGKNPVANIQNLISIVLHVSKAITCASKIQFF